MATTAKSRPVRPIVSMVGLSLLALLVAWWLWPKSPLQPERLSGDVAQALVEGDPLPLGSVVTKQGSPLSKEALEGVRNIVRPRLSGFQVESAHEDTIRSSARYATVLKREDGERRYLSIVSWRAPEGAFVTLGEVLSGAWTLDGQRSGFGKLDRVAKAKLCLAGLESDRTALEKLGLEGMEGDDGTFHPWSELDAYYRAVIEQGVPTGRP